MRFNSAESNRTPDKMHKIRKLKIGTKRIIISFFLFGAVHGKPLAVTSDTVTPLNNLSLKVYYHQAKENDTLIITMIDTWNQNKSIDYTSVIGNDGLFTFYVSTKEECGYWQIKKRRQELKASRNISYQYLTIPFFWEKGDKIVLELSNKTTQLGIHSQYSFSGTGAEKCNLRANIFDYTLPNKFLNESNLNSPVFNEKLEYVKEIHPLMEYRISLLKDSKMAVSTLSYEVLEADILYQFGFFSEVKNFHHTFLLEADRKTQEKLKEGYFSTIDSVFLSSIHKKGFTYSYYGLQFLMAKYKADVLVSNGAISSLALYNYIKQHSDTEQRERLLIQYFIDEKTSLSQDSILADASSLFTTTRGQKEFHDIKSIGESFLEKYAFLDTADNSVELSSFKGQIVLIDFYFTGCGACAALYKSVLSKIKNVYKEDDQILFVSVSADKDKDFWLKGIESGMYTSVAKNVVNLYTGKDGFNHRVFKDNMFNTFPTLVLIDQTENRSYFNSEVLYSYEGLIDIIETLKKSI